METLETKEQRQHPVEQLLHECSDRHSLFATTTNDDSLASVSPRTRHRRRRLRGVWREARARLLTRLFPVGGDVGGGRGGDGNDNDNDVSTEIHHHHAFMTRSAAHSPTTANGDTQTSTTASLDSETRNAIFAVLREQFPSASTDTGNSPSNMPLSQVPHLLDAIERRLNRACVRDAETRRKLHERCQSEEGGVVSWEQLLVLIEGLLGVVGHEASKGAPLSTTTTRPSPPSSETRRRQQHSQPHLSSEVDDDGASLSSSAVSRSLVFDAAADTSLAASSTSSLFLTEELHDRNRELARRLAETQRALQRAVDHQQQRESELEHQLTAAQSDLRTKHRQLTALQERVDSEFTRRMDELNEENARLREEKMVYQRQWRELTDRVHHAASKNAESTAALTRVHQDLVTTQSRVKELVVERDLLHQQLEHERERADAQQQQDVTVTLDQLVSDDGQREALVEHLERENAAMRQQLSMLPAKPSNTDEYYQQMEQELDGLREQVRDAWQRWDAEHRAKEAVKRKAAWVEERLRASLLDAGVAVPDDDDGNDDEQTVLPDHQVCKLTAEVDRHLRELDEAWRQCGASAQHHEFDAELTRRRTECQAAVRELQTLLLVTTRQHGGTPSLWNDQEAVSWIERGGEGGDGDTFSLAQHTDLGPRESTVQLPMTPTAPKIAQLLERRNYELATYKVQVANLTAQIEEMKSRGGSPVSSGEITAESAQSPSEILQQLEQADKSHSNTMRTSSAKKSSSSFVVSKRKSSSPRVSPVAKRVILVETKRSPTTPPSNFHANLLAYSFMAFLAFLAMMIFLNFTLSWSFNDGSVDDFGVVYGGGGYDDDAAATAMSAHWHELELVFNTDIRQWHAMWAAVMDWVRALLEQCEHWASDAWASLPLSSWWNENVE